MAKTKGSTDIDVEGVSVALRGVVARLASWKQERAAIAADLLALVRTAEGIIAELGPMDRTAATGRRTSGRRKGYVMSAATKAKLRAAWARRKALAAGRVPRSMSPEARARIAAAQKARWAKQRKADA